MNETKFLDLAAMFKVLIAVIVKDSVIFATDYVLLIAYLRSWFIDRFKLLERPPEGLHNFYFFFGTCWNWSGGLLFYKFTFRVRVIHTSSDENCNP